MDLTEFQTRKQMIDVLLREQGWIVSDRSSVRTEVDTKQSDFRIQDYKTVSETLRNDLESKFWNEVTYEDSQMLIREFAELMRFKLPEPREPIILDMDDMIQQRKIIEFGPELKEEYVDTYKEKVEKRINDLVESDVAIKKIRSGDVLTEKDLIKLEETLNSPELFITEENLRKVYDQSRGTLVEFIKNILDLYEFPDPAVKVRDAFHTYIIENNKQYSADQLNFIRAIQTFFVDRRHIEVDDLFEAPFTNFGTNYPIPEFTSDELSDFIKICGRLEEELFGEEGT